MKHKARLGLWMKKQLLTLAVTGLGGCLQTVALASGPAISAHAIDKQIAAQAGVSPEGATATQQQAAEALQAAMVGNWVGTLAYRDYAEPATSTRRVLLPTWLTVMQDDQHLQWHYVYDDGPAKVVTADEQIRVKVDAGGTASYVTQPGDGKPEQRLMIQGLDTLKAGHGTVTMTGQIVENNSPAQIRVTLHLARNLLQLTRETAAPGQPLAFRDAYTFVRKDAPLPAGASTAAQ